MKEYVGFYRSALVSWVGDMFADVFPWTAVILGLNSVTFYGTEGSTWDEWMLVNKMSSFGTNYARDIAL